MVAKCRTCSHDERARIELALCRGVPLRVVGQKFGLPTDALHRHFKNHVDPRLRASLATGVELGKVDLEKLKREESERLLQNLVAYTGRLLLLVSQAEDLGDFAAAARLWGRLLDAWALEAKFLGELRRDATHVTNNLVVVPVLMELRAELLLALKPHPEARRAAAEALQRIELKAIEQQADDAQAA